MDSFQVREQLHELIVRDLLGPWGGDNEEIPPELGAPRERYLVGMLGPKDAAPDPGLLEVDASEDGDAADDEPREILPGSAPGQIWASSMGLRFQVPLDLDAVTVVISWGRYRRVDSERLQTDSGQPRKVWRREPVHREHEIRLDRARQLRLLAHPEIDDVWLRVDIRARPGRRVVELALVNGQHQPDRLKDVAWLFQPRIVVTALDGASPVFLPTADPLVDDDGDPDPEERRLDLLYRDVLEYTVGRNVAVHAEAALGARCAHRLATTWIPAYEIPQTVVPDTSADDLLAGLELGMEALAEATPDELRQVLAPLADGYQHWLDKEAARASELPAHLGDAADTAVAAARHIARRIRVGIDLVADGGAAYEAFCFANRAMALQRRHTEIARARADDPDLIYSQAEQHIAARGASVARWRPFQLAFILLNLPPLVDPTHPDRSAGHDAIVDLLFFPTGGGKTEAYLGLTAFTLAIRRVQGVLGAGVDARDGRDGVAVLMRYTLRLLTAQQFQRAAALICACEQLRRDANAGGDDRWGERPFRIGLWVGSRVSPNWYEQAADDVAYARERARAGDVGVLQVLTCPWCGTPLDASRDLRADDARRRILVHCGDPDGRCPFTPARSEEGLPILTVDEEIYRLTPSLVIATVDKLARLPWAGYAGMLFGRVDRHCPRHGHRHDDLDDKTGCHGRHNRAGDLSPVTSEPVVRLRPPDLIIQDELHLISGSLGTTVGLFEAAVEQLCTWQLGDVAVTPKIVASTATVKRADAQVDGLFARRLAVFPPPVLDVDDSFFARQDPVSAEQPGRRYLGICAHGVRLKLAEIRVAETMLLATQWLFDQYGDAADPFMTLVQYFNATRELAGMRRYLDDDVATRVRKNGSRRGLPNRLLTTNKMLVVEELTSRIPSSKIAATLKGLEAPFATAHDTTAAREQLRDALRRAKNDRTVALPQRRRGPEPLDVVLATSMLQVGVDVSRLGLMVVTGQPKNTAEYIQASSRVGRDPSRPGLIVTLYNWARPRDLAHYEQFGHYHATFYRQVEALSVTPFARRALDRGLAGTLVAAVRNAETRWSRIRDAQDVQLDAAVIQQFERQLLDRADHVAGAQGREYAREKLHQLVDEWRRRQQRDEARLGYESRTRGGVALDGLLERASTGRWDLFTVADSMRETENEINLLLPARTLVDLSAEHAPHWAWGDTPFDDEDITMSEGLAPAEERR